MEGKQMHERSLEDAQSTMRAWQLDCNVAGLSIVRARCLGVLSWSMAVPAMALAIIKR
jgi:hypothetical protein